MDITTTQIAKELGISAIKLNKILIENDIICKRGRPAKSEKGKFRAYYWINKDFIKYGYNNINPRGGSVPKWYIHTKKEFMSKIMLKMLSKHT